MTIVDLAWGAVLAASVSARRRASMGRWEPERLADIRRRRRTDIDEIAEAVGDAQQMA